MDKKLLEAISNALPEIQVKTIKEALIERDALRITVEALTKSLEATEKSKRELTTTTANMTDEIAGLKAQNEVLLASNMELVGKDIENCVQIAHAELAAVERTVGRFLKNTIYRESLQHQVVDETPNIQNSYNGSAYTPVNVGTNKVNRPVTDVKTSESE